MSNIGLIVYGGEKPQVPLQLSKGTSRLAVERSIKILSKIGGRRKMDKVLDLIAKEFKLQSRRKNVGKLALLLTAGEDENGEKPKFEDASKLLETEGVRLVIVKIGKPLKKESIDEIGMSLINGLIDIRSPSELLNAIELVEKSTADSSSVFEFSLSY